MTDRPRRDGRDQAIQRDTARAAALDAELQKTTVAVRAALRDLDDATFDALAAHPALDGGITEVRAQELADGEAGEGEQEVEEAQQDEAEDEAQAPPVGGQPGVHVREIQQPREGAEVG